jgi:hypothetical protein
MYRFPQLHGYYKKTNYFFASVSHLLVKMEGVHVQILHVTNLVIA